MDNVYFAYFLESYLNEINQEKVAKMSDEKKASAKAKLNTFGAKSGQFINDYVGKWLDKGSTTPTELKNLGKKATLSVKYHKQRETPLPSTK